MSDLITRTARLVPYAKRPKQVPSFVTAYSYEPMANDAAAPLGNLYVVIEVLVGGRTSEEVADLVIQTLGEQYYREPDDGRDSLAHFEGAVKAANRELSEYVSQGNAAWIGKISAIAAVQAGEEIHLTQTGSAEAYLYRGRATSRISTPPADRPTGPSKTFGSIASGMLEAHDHLLLATPALVHQLPLPRLHDVASTGNPNTAIAELTELLRGSQSERIAALVIEVTTPEQAALQVRSDEPSEIHLGTPENALEAAKLAAQPLANATVAQTKRVGAHARTGLTRAKPHLQRLGYGAAERLRALLSSSRGRQIAVGVVVLVAIIVGWLIVAHGASANTATLLTRYTADYQAYQSADQAAVAGAKDDAHSRLVSLQQELTSLSSVRGRPALDTKLKHTSLPSGEPNSVAGLSTLVGSRLDSLEGLAKASVTTVVSVAKGSKPTHLEILSGKAYLIESGSKMAISVVDITTKQIKTSHADTTGLGTVVGTTLSSAGDGIYILTTKPSVWFYKFDSDNIIEQTINQASWPAAKAIASYATNLYLLGDQGVYKHTRTYSGFSPRTDYLTGLSDPKALAVDGNVYVLTPSGLQLYLAGVLKATAEVPQSLATATTLRSPAGGNTLLAVGSDSKRLGFWDFHTTLIFSKQYSLTGTNALYDAAYDDKTQTAYALVDGRLVKFSVK